MRALALLALLALGCGVGAEHPISTWTLQSEGTARKVVVPSHLDVPERFAQYTLDADIPIPPELRALPLDLVIPSFPALARLSVDGIDAIELEPDLIDGYRGVGPKRWRLPDQMRGRSTVHATLIVDHRWYQSGWINTVPRLTPVGADDRELIVIRLINGYGSIFGLVGLTLLGIVYLAVFLVDRRRREYLWFAIQGLSAGSYPLFVSGLSQALFGRFDYVYLLVLLPTAALASVPFTHETLRIGRTSRVWLGLFVINAIAAVLLASDPFAAGRFGAPLVVGTVGVVVVYQLWVCGRRAFRRERPVGARYLFVAWSWLALLAGFDLLVWVGGPDLLQGARTGGVALGLFAVSQAMLLGREHIASLRRSDDLNAALAARVEQLERHQREVDLLNQELRRQIADRSEQLFGALRTLAASAGAAPALAEGQVIDERYRVVRALGAGGMGAVYEVVRLSDNTRLALKVAQQQDAVALARLAREAQIAAQVDHPNVVSIVDVDVASAGFLYIVIELVQGNALDQRVERHGDIAWVVPVLAQVSAGLAALHRHGIVHRDLKPANVLIEDGTDGVPRAKVADFGISRLADGSGESNLAATAVLKPGLAATERTPDSAKKTPNSSPLTSTGFVAGTPMYMAPELITGGSEVSPTADIFSFGVLAFQLLARQMPWSEPPSVSFAERRPVGEPRSLRSERPDLPPHVAEIISRCLSLAPALRPTAAELAVVLSDVRPQSPIAVGRGKKNADDTNRPLGSE